MDATRPDLVLPLRWIRRAASVLLATLAVRAGARGDPWMVFAGAALAWWSVDVVLDRLPQQPPVGPFRSALGLAADIVLLAIVLAGTGGDANPFAPLFILPVTAAALALPRTQSWALLALAAEAYGGLLLLAPADLTRHDPNAMRGHILGMYVAFLVSGGTIAIAADHLRRARLAANARMEAARSLEEQGRRLASLATLAAGAAHELSTPLATILVVVREMERRARSERDRSDLALVRDEVLRCRRILEELAADAGAPSAEPAPVMPLAELVRPDPRWPPNVTVQCGSPEARVRVPTRKLRMCLRRLVDNAAQASPPGGCIEIAAEADGPDLVIRVRDHGRGMPPEVAARAGEPFFTTRPDGRGLGLYFVRSVLQAAGGALTLESAPGVGTTVTLRWPDVVVAEPAHEPAPPAGGRP